MQHIFIIGSKGIPSQYGGYETFVDKLTEYHQQNMDLKYHIACKSEQQGEFEYHNARCFEIKIPNIGSAQAILYDILALRECCKYIKRNNIPHAVVYVLACRIGPFIAFFQKKIHQLGGKLYLNPDGHEWMRAKWNFWIRKYWKISEKLMIKCSDLIICDSKNIKTYIDEKYKKYNPMTIYIAYGAELAEKAIKKEDSKLVNWYHSKGIKQKEYYLVVGRFVPENNFEIMIKEFMKSKTKRDFVLITNINITDKFFKELKKKTSFDQDERIKFVGTVYDQQLLVKIRQNAYAYLHGHEVGGTNPSLLEALGSTDLNLLLNVGFNYECAENSALYWSKEEGSLTNLINQVDTMDLNQIARFGRRSNERIKEVYSWKFISNEYYKIFMKYK